MTVRTIVPVWLRPAAIAAVAMAHAAVIVDVAWPTSESSAVVMAPIAIEVVPQGPAETAAEAPQQAQIADTTAVEPEPSDVEPAAAAADDPVKQAALSPLPETTPIAPSAPFAVGVEVPEPLPKPVVEAKKPKHRREPSQAAAARSQASALAHQAMANAVGGAAGSAAYRSIVAAELNRRKFYPPAARSSGVQGVVTVTFTVGARGTVTGHTITRSSGHIVLDQAVNQMMAAMSLPPPPGGAFRATVPIQFNVQ